MGAKEAPGWFGGMLTRTDTTSTLGASPLPCNILGSRYSPARHVPRVREDLSASTAVAKLTIPG